MRSRKKPRSSARIFQLRCRAKAASLRVLLERRRIGSANTRPIGRRLKRLVRAKCHDATPEYKESLKPSFSSNLQWCESNAQKNSQSSKASSDHPPSSPQSRARQRHSKPTPTLPPSSTPPSPCATASKKAKTRAKTRPPQSARPRASTPTSLSSFFQYSYCSVCANDIPTLLL